MLLPLLSVPFILDNLLKAINHAGVSLRAAASGLNLSVCVLSLRKLLGQDQKSLHSCLHYIERVPKTLINAAHAQQIASLT